jgi:cytochrome c-type biogenesis protein CcmE
MHEQLRILCICMIMCILCVCVGIYIYNVNICHVYTHVYSVYPNISVSSKAKQWHLFKNAGCH